MPLDPSYFDAQPSFQQSSFRGQTLPEGKPNLANIEGLDDRDDDDDELSVFGSMVDIGRGAGNGFVGFGQSLLGLADSGVEAFGGDLVNDRYTDNPAFGETTTIAGGLVEGITQFATGFIPVAGVLGKVGWLSKMKNANRLGAGAFDLSAGAVADFLSFQGHEERLSDLIQEYPNLQNPITELLASDSGDSEAMGRFKNTLEGMGMGGLAGTLGAAVRATGLTKKLKNFLTDDVQLDQATGKVRETDDVQSLEDLEKAFEDNLRELEGGLNNAQDPSAVEDIAVSRFNQKRVTEEQMQTALNDLEKVKRGEAGVSDLGREIWPNINKMEMESGTQETLKFLSNAYHKNISAARSTKTEIRTETRSDGRKVKLEPGQKSFKETEREAIRERLVSDIADATGLDIPEFRKRMRKRAQDSDRMDSDMLAARTLMQAKTENINKLVNAPMTDRGKAMLINEMRAFKDLLVDVTAVRTAAARTTTQGRIRIDASFDSDKLTRAVREMGGSKKMESMIYHLQTQAGNPKGIRQVVESRFDRGFRKIIDVHNEVFINQILSGPITSAVNITSNFAHMFMMPTEKALGGVGDVIWGDTRSGVEQIQEAGLLITGLASSALDGLKGFGRSLEAGQNILAPNSNVIDAPVGTIANSRSTSSARELSQRGGRTIRNIGDGSAFDTSDEANVYQTALDFMGNAVRLPGRALTAQDEFFKITSYRAHVRMKALREAKMKGLKGQQRTEFLQSRLQKSFDPSTGEGLDQESLQYANKLTFTEDLEGAFGANLQRLVDAAPMLRVALPFVRTPTNLLINVMERTPGLNFASRRYRNQFFSSDPRVRSQARGKFATGTLLATSAAVLAANGKMNGGGPRDPDQRQKWLNAGNVPYSFRFNQPDGTVKSVSFGRIDPWASFFGVAADAAEIAKASQEPGADREVTSIIGGLAMAVAEQTTNKSYLTGLQNVLNAITDPEANADTFLQRHAASLVVPNVLNQLNPDDIIRETRTYTDNVLRRIPGYSEGVAPKRDFFGKPIRYADRFNPTPIPGAEVVSPYNIDTFDPNSVEAEIASLDKGFQPPRRETPEGIKLDEWKNNKGQSAYDRWQELHGIVKIGGKTMRDRLEDLFQSEFYQSLPEQEQLGEFAESRRVSLVRRIRSRYRNVARRRMLQEYPELRKSLLQRKRAVSRAEILGLATE